jgi:hypothetical protein
MMVKTDNKNNAGYEKRDVNIFMVIGLAVLLVSLLIVILVFLIDYFVDSKEQMIYEAHLQPDSGDLKSLLASERKELTSFKILDTERGIYQIPIDRAMDLLVKEASTTN